MRADQARWILTLTIPTVLDAKPREITVKAA